MATNTTDTDDADDRYPTTGPDTESYDRYRHVTTGDEAIIYDTETEGAWIQAELSLDLEDWQ
ncbi:MULTISPECIES: DUF7331 family protein [Haloarcula]|uniref:Uncharacterized protein n=1 Tax=Haloarcula pellucida TaxID=1427151 RepID=A0A830GQ62_9EURY|nr:MULTISPECIES: hypothetical protein [Halomicroarcula]MBX0347889.1 hypothetical protein [Halomicroarcula pellucida]MDS0279982.1 hypothetical protein [Halomicroarcula sp. S1AR25-4]GGN95915.1 hypothetical protein GCM10009030_23580 [Halomicroarcula pellucida]